MGEGFRTVDTPAQVNSAHPLKSHIGQYDIYFVRCQQYQRLLSRLSRNHIILVLEILFQISQKTGIILNNKHQRKVRTFCYFNFRFIFLDLIGHCTYRKFQYKLRTICLVGQEQTTTMKFCKILCIGQPDTETLSIRTLISRELYKRFEYRLPS